METNEDSIKMLEMRMRHQLNVSSEKNIKPENIQYYVSSAMLEKERIPQNADIDEGKAAEQTVYGRPQDGPKMTEAEKGIWQQNVLGSYGKVRLIAQENELYERLPADVDYIQESDRMISEMEYMKISEIIKGAESKEVQLARAKSGYESVRRSLDEEDSSGKIRLYSLNLKG